MSEIFAVTVLAMVAMVLTRRRDEDNPKQEPEEPIPKRPKPKPGPPRHKKPIPTKRKPKPPELKPKPTKESKGKKERGRLLLRLVRVFRILRATKQLLGWLRSLPDHEDELLREHEREPDL